jgi:hypothetical protein
LEADGTAAEYLDAINASQDSVKQFADIVFDIFGPGLWDNPELADKALRLVEETPSEFGNVIIWALLKIPPDARGKYRNRIQRIANKYGAYVQQTGSESSTLRESSMTPDLTKVHKQIQAFVPPEHRSVDDRFNYIHEIPFIPEP